MLRVERLIQLVFGLTCCTSGVLLGFSQRDWTLAIIAISSVTLGWILCDWLKWIVVRSWVANLLSISVLILAMRNFFSVDSGSQLLAVANLLVYLQMVLLFQKKSPRLYWQLSVLSLLQVVVATIFSIRFEGGLFFVLYMVLAAGGLTLVTIYHQSWRSKKHANVASRKMTAQLNSFAVVSDSSTPLVAFDQTVSDNRILRRMIRHLSMWILVSLVFSMLLFYKIPRTESAFFGSRFLKTMATGATQSLELDERGTIRQSNNVVMRVKFFDPRNEQPIKLLAPPYFRGMALSDVRVVDGITTFKAPYDRVYGFVYEELSSARSSTPQIAMDVTLEPTADALLYGCMPAYRHRKEGQRTFDFCHELSALTRRRHGEQIRFAPFEYSLATVSKSLNRLPNYWPYKPEASIPSAKSMRGNRGQWNWLTKFERERYPGLVKLADDIAKRSKDPADFYRLAKEMTRFFKASSGYSYTLNFSNVARDETLDPIEDFVVNHKTGHCSLYAASLCLMLRSQGIPARVVTGFYGGAYNELGESYLVTGKHAHSWVEAYIPPEDCAPLSSHFDLSETGAWLTLDATPEIPYEFSASEDAIDMARTLWQGYVLGLDDEQQTQGWITQDSKLLGLFDMSNWSEQVSSATEEYRTNPIWKLLIASAMVIVLMSIAFFSSRKAAKRRHASGVVPTSRIRKLVGRAVLLIAPGLGTWLIHGGSTPTIPFYEKLLAILERHGHKRLASQTHREFAEQIIEHYREHEKSVFIRDIMTQATESFNQVRFGGKGVTSSNERAIESELRELKSILAS